MTEKKVSTNSDLKRKRKFLVEQASVVFGWTGEKPDYAEYYENLEIVDADQYFRSIRKEDYRNKTPSPSNP